MFYFGFGILVVVLVFKVVMYFVFFMGILFGFGIFWLVGEVVYCYKDEDVCCFFILVYVLICIDMSLIVFFVGILMVVVCLEYVCVFELLVKWLDVIVGCFDVIVIFFGFLSVIIDNVLFVVVIMGMYNLV